MNIITKLVGLIFIISLLFSCKSKLDQSTMFSGRTHKNKKGVYNTGLTGKKTPSLQIAKEYDKLSKYDTKPKKAAKKANKALAKKKAVMAKKNTKFVKKKKLGVKPGKKKTGGDK
jgi:FtsZ-interacting cell division protein ZipA